MLNVRQIMREVRIVLLAALFAFLLVFTGGTSAMAGTNFGQAGTNFAMTEEAPDGVDAEFGTSAPDASANSGVIRSNSGSDQRLLACKDWGASGICGKTSPTGLLSPGENTKTKFGWSDSDGVYVATGCVLRNTSGTIVAYGGHWFKVSGFFGATFTYRHDC